MKTSDLIMCGGFLTMALVVVVQFYFVRQLLETLENRFNELWVQLGKPSLITNNSLSSNMALYSFLWHKKYVGLGDIQFSKQCSTVRLFSVFALVIGVGWLVTGLGVILLTK